MRPPVITFGGIPATNVSVVGSAHYRATAPAHAEGAAEVVLTDQVQTLRSFAFRYYDPAKPPLPELFERILFPVVYDGPGLHGSLWSTELAVANRNAHVVEPWREFPELTAIPRLRATELELPQAPAGIFVVIPRESAAALGFSALVRDLSRDAREWGTEIPVVRERDFSETAVNLLNVPLDRRYRRTLRIYGLGSVDSFARVVMHEMDGGSRFAERLVKLTSPAPCATVPLCASDRPSFATLELDQSFGGFSSNERVAVRVERWAGLPVWAFLTVTNNETQHVTVISPH